MPHLLALLLLAAPVAETVESSPLLSVSGALAYAGGMAPGDSMGGVLGARHRFGRFSLGLELQFLGPGSASVDSGEVELYLPIHRRWPDRGGSTSYARGFGVVGSLPVCAHQSVLSACAVVTAGGVQTTRWQPLLSAGLRGAAEYPQQSAIRVRATAQVAGGILRPQSGGWSASPVQLGFSLGMVFDTL